MPDGHTRKGGRLQGAHRLAGLKLLRRKMQKSESRRRLDESAGEREAQATPEQSSRLGKIGARTRWGPKSETTKPAKKLGISRQAPWARLKKGKGKKKRKKG